jgi:hypothetical protein
LVEKVSCDGKWKAAGKDDTLECRATAGDGTPIQIGVTVADDHGNVRWATR